MKGMVSMNDKSEKEILDMLSNSIGKDTPDVWDKIKNSKKSRFSDIECDIPEPVRYRKTFSIKRISAIAAVFLVIITGVYFGSGVLKMTGNKVNMSADPRFYITEANNTLYYQDFTDGCKLYSMNSDGSNRKKLCNDYVVDLVTDGEYIYYSNLNDGKEYKIRTDGTGREVIANIKGWNLNVSGDSVYFSAEDGVYSVKKDGSGLKRLTDIASPSTLWLYGNRLYFFATYEECIYGMDLDGSNLQKIINDCAYNFRLANNYIYFGRYDAEHKIYLYRANIDGTGVEKISDFTISTGAYDIKDNNIYFDGSVKNISAIYKMQYNRSNITKLTELKTVTTIKVLGEWVYCYQPWGTLSRISLDGQIQSRILSKDEKVGSLK